MQRAVSRDSRLGEGRKRNSRHGELRTETAVMGDPKTETAEGNKILPAAVSNYIIPGQAPSGYP